MKDIPGDASPRLVEIPQPMHQLVEVYGRARGIVEYTLKDASSESSITRSLARGFDFRTERAVAQPATPAPTMIAKEKRKVSEVCIS